MQNFQTEEKVHNFNLRIFVNKTLYCVNNINPACFGTVCAQGVALLKDSVTTEENYIERYPALRNSCPRLQPLITLERGISVRTEASTSNSCGDLGNLCS